MGYSSGLGAQQWDNMVSPRKASHIPKSGAHEGEKLDVPHPAIDGLEKEQPQLGNVTSCDLDIGEYTSEEGRVKYLRYI